MIEINYYKSQDGKDTCFDYSYSFNEYMSGDFLARCGDEDSIEYAYFILLLNRAGLFDGNAAHYHHGLFGYTLDCFFGSIPFYMNYDETDCCVSFSILPSYAEYRTQIAECISRLMEEKPDL